MKYIFLDTETTGIDEEDRLCQLAFSYEGKHVCKLYKPELPIKIESMAITHITNEMVEDAPAFKDSPEFTFLKDLLQQDDVCLVAHNAKFDLGMLKKEGITAKNHICTMKVARRLDKEGQFANVTLQYLRYFYGIKIEATAHDAMGDVMVLEQVFAHLKKLVQQLKGKDEVDEDMIRVSKEPMLFVKMPYGKHRGVKLMDVPGDYMEWLERQTDLDEDMRFTVKHYFSNKK